MKTRKHPGQRVFYQKARNCRILDDQDVRHAWGAEQKVMEFFQKVLHGR